MPGASSCSRSPSRLPRQSTDVAACPPTSISVRAWEPWFDRVPDFGCLSYNIMIYPGWISERVPTCTLHYSWWKPLGACSCFAKQPVGDLKVLSARCRRHDEQATFTVSNVCAFGCRELNTLVSSLRAIARRSICCYTYEYHSSRDFASNNVRPQGGRPMETSCCNRNSSSRPSASNSRRGRGR